MKIITLDPKIFVLLQEICKNTNETPSETIEALISIASSAMSGGCQCNENGDCDCDDCECGEEE